MVKKFDLKALIDRVDWVTLNSGRTGSRLPDDKIAVSFFKSKKNAEDADYIRVRLGPKVLEELGWHEHDKISAMHDPDDLLSFLLVKTTNGSGRALHKESSSSVHAVQFKWTKDLTLKPLPSTVVEHDLYKQYVHFRLPQQEV